MTWLLQPLFFLQPCDQFVTTKNSACNNQILCLLEFQRHSCCKVVTWLLQPLFFFQPCDQVVTTKNSACNNQILCLLEFQRHSCCNIVTWLLQPLFFSNHVTRLLQPRTLLVTTKYCACYIFKGILVARL